MALFTNELISDAYYASGIVSREFETVNGSQITDGLKFLNNILSDKVVEMNMVPYEGQYNFTADANVESYQIPNLIKIDTIVFFKENLRYAMKYESRNRYFGSMRAEQIKSLPFMWYFERNYGGGKLYIYFKPDQNYPFEVHGIFRMSNVSLGQDLSLTLDEFYTTYLHFALADRLCVEYSINTPPSITEYLAQYKRWINKQSRPMDLRLNKVSIVARKRTLSIDSANLFTGFIPPY